MRTRLVVALSALAIAALLVLPGPALAAAPETPETVKPELETIFAESATLRGFLNPNAPGEAGATYQFLYRASATECAGGSAGPEPEEASLGAQGEEVRQHIEGLTPQTRYSACLKARSTGGEVSVGPVVHFLTGPPETPTGEEALNVTASSATLKGVLNPSSPGEPGKYRFRYRQSASECEGDGTKTIPDDNLGEPPFSSAGNQAEVVETPLSGLLPATSYTFCIFARTESFESVVGAPVTFTTSASGPAIRAESAVSITSNGATVAAAISPGGLPTGYHVEFVTAAQFAISGWAGASRVPLSNISLPAASTALPVQQKLEGLAAATVYRFRFAATNSLAEVPGADATFATAAVGVAALTLPDGRAYELVSGPAANPTTAYVPRSGKTTPVSFSLTEFPFRASADGESLAYAGAPENSGGNGLTGQGLGNTLISARSPRQGVWQATDISPQTSGEGESAQAAPYESFSEDLSVGLLDTSKFSSSFAASTSPPGPADCAGLYARKPSGFSALFGQTQSPGECGITRAESERYSVQSLIFTGFTASDSELLFQTSAGLTPGDTVSPSGEGNNLYVSVAGQATPVNVLPDGTREPQAVFGSTSGEPFPPSAEPSQDHVPGNFGHIAAADGSRVFWTALEPKEELGRPAAMGLKALYVRENPLSPSATTTQLDVPQGSATGTAGGGRFWTASTDGSRVFFTDCSRLTEGSTAVSSEGCFHTVELGGNPRILATGNDLYEYDFNKSVGSRLSDLSVDSHGDLLGADVQGVVGASADGSYVYFVAGGALAPSAEARVCRQANEEKEEKEFLGTLTPAEKERLESEQGQEEAGHLPPGRGCNLYVSHDGEAPRFIAALGARDNQLIRVEGAGAGGTGFLGSWRPSLGQRTATLTPNGRDLLFESTQQLTGYDNSSLGSEDAQRSLEVFTYSATDGRLLCASCAPDGAPPSPEEGINENRVGGTYLPVSMNPTYMQRLMSADGDRVFFDTSQPLVPQDTNGTQDVYEWEREATPGCPTPTSVNGGCVFLLSGGNSPSFSFFLDADAEGDNVFFTHRGPLAGIGPSRNTNVIYDARVDGGFAGSSAGCSGGSCPASSIGAVPFTAPASPSFEGPGNQKPAKKKKQKKHHKHKRKHHHAKGRHHRPASNNRGAK